MTVGYAENGRGKTTLSAILRSLADPVPILERKRVGGREPTKIVIECTGSTQPAIFDNGAWNRTLPTSRFSMMPL
jgi:hypothetical protein